MAEPRTNVPVVREDSQGHLHIVADPEYFQGVEAARLRRLARLEQGAAGG